jgi:two-component system, LytTR family, response regulator LytT
MTMIKTLIVEDEELLAKNLELTLKEIDPTIEVAARLESVTSSIKWLTNNKADLIFLDIQLSDGLSFDIFDKVNVDVPVIFLTAYDHYAIRAFKLNSIDYLLKPLNINDLSSALDKFRKHSGSNNDLQEFRKLMQMIKTKSCNYKKRFVVHVGEKIKYIEAENIAYFFIVEGETFMRDFEGSTNACDYSLDKLEPEIDPAIFFRVNRQYTVNLKAIKQMFTMSKSAIKLDLLPKPDENVFVSLSRSSYFKKWLNQ